MFSIYVSRIERYRMVNLEEAVSVVKCIRADLKNQYKTKNCHQFDAVNVIVCIIVLCCQYLYKVRLMIAISFEMQDVSKVCHCLLYPLCVFFMNVTCKCVLQSLLSNASSHIRDETSRLREATLNSWSVSVCVATYRICIYNYRIDVCILNCLNKKWLNRALCFCTYTCLCLFEKLDFIGVFTFRNWQWKWVVTKQILENWWWQFHASDSCFMMQWQYFDMKGKGKGKVHPCTGTEALYRPYGPQGE